MNRLIFIMSLLLILAVPRAWASTSPYPNPNRQTIWNNMTDSVHTWGQTPKQAVLTKRRLHHARTLTRIHDINQAKRQAWMQANN